MAFGLLIISWVFFEWYCLGFHRFPRLVQMAQARRHGFCPSLSHGRKPFFSKQRLVRIVVCVCVCVRV